MKNEEVCEIFVRSNEEAKTKNLFIEGNVLYSYGYHYPLAIKLFGGFIVNSDRYSMTTARHKFHIKRELNGDFIEFNTQQIKEILSSDVNNIEEAKNFFVLKAL